jgi:hypothetical protein
MSVDLTTKTAAQLAARLAQLEKIAAKEPAGGTRFEDLFRERFEVQREVILIFIEIARRQVVQL